MNRPHSWSICAEDMGCKRVAEPDILASSRTTGHAQSPQCILHNKPHHGHLPGISPTACTPG